MGTGKTAVGRLLARQLGWTFIDTDDLIEQRAGKSITAIFAEDGEPAFRAIEAAVAGELAGLTGHVVATGGGLVLREENLRACERAGAVVLLEASPEQIWRRVKHHTHRPLLQKSDPRGEIERLLDQRREAYGRIALRVGTDTLRAEEVAGAILRLLAPAPEAPAAAQMQAEPAERVRVELGERSYPILIGENWIGRLGEYLSPVFPPRPCMIVTNPQIGRLWGRTVVQGLEQAGYRVGVCEIPEGEGNKTIQAVSRIHDRMIREKHTRQSGVIALGGGIVGDIAGFAAATMLRGIPYIQLPTSLLAMVDSSVGGKTGVNHPLGKNLIGAFWQPALVGAEIGFLRTLADEELRSGLAEVIKYGVIADAGFFEYLEEHIEAALARDAGVLTHIVARSCRIKAEVVGADERESGQRAILNFGHTFGHAAEALSGYDTIRHGEGVAMGMVAAARLAQRRGLLAEADAGRIQALTARAGLPVRMLRFAPEQYWAWMGSDKKVRDGRIRFVLPARIGHAGLYGDVTQEETAATLEAVMEAKSRPKARPIDLA
jgi:3-dehydroquinate synthase